MEGFKSAQYLDRFVSIRPIGLTASRQSGNFHATRRRHRSALERERYCWICGGTRKTKGLGTGTLHQSGQGFATYRMMQIGRGVIRTRRPYGNVGARISSRVGQFEILWLCSPALTCCSLEPPYLPGELVLFGDGPENGDAMGPFAKIDSPFQAGMEQARSLGVSQQK